AVLPNPLRYLGHPHATAGKRKRVVDEHCKAASGNLVGPGDSAIVVVLMSDNDFPRLVINASDLPPAEELVATVIVEGQNARQRTLGSGRLEKYRFRTRSTGELPRKSLHVQPVEFIR